jgi:radical SAM protein with 4Fe4S-binding SPASM domain
MCIVTFDWEGNDANDKVRAFRKKGSISWAVIEVTNNCNLNCVWCYANSGKTPKQEHMEFADLKGLLKILADAGVRQVTYSGGEPTIYPHIREAVKAAKDYGFIVHMNTNGYVLTREFARDLKRLGLSQVQSNIDSTDPGKHDYMRGRKGSFGRAIKAMRNAREAGITVTSQTVLTRENESEIIDIFRLARGLGLQRSRVWDMMPSEGCALENAHLKPTDYIKTLRKLADFVEGNGGMHIESGEPFFPGDYKTGLKVSHVPCVASHGVLINFSFRGDVYYCVTHRKPMFNVFKDLNGERLDEFYKERLRGFLDSMELSEKCMKCPSLQTCRGGCNTRRGFSRENMDYFCSIAQEP